MGEEGLAHEQRGPHQIHEGAEFLAGKSARRLQDDEEARFATETVRNQKDPRSRDGMRARGINHSPLPPREPRTS